PNALLQKLKNILFQKPEAFDLKVWWNIHYQIMDLEEGSLDNPALQEVVKARINLRNEMISQICKEDYPQLHELVQKRIHQIKDILEQDSSSLEVQLERENKTRDELHFLLRLLHKSQGKFPSSPSKTIEIELEDLEGILEVLKSQNGSTLDQVIHDRSITELSLFQKEYESFSQSLKESLSKIQGKLGWKFFEECHRLIRTGESLYRKLDQKECKIAEKGIEELHFCRKELKEKLILLPKEELLIFIESFFEASSSLMAKIEEVPLPKAIHLLENARLQLEDIRPLVEKLKENKDVRKRYKKFFTFFRNEEMEKKLQHRLESIFGYTFVSILENTILFLIFAVIGLLVFEWGWEKSLTPEAKRMLLQIDVAICFIFLAEFFLKLFLSINKFLYFRNHFWFDFLPSIPFSLLHLAQADVARAGRIARLGRLARLLRYVRVARPLIRLGRVFLFMLRVIDRLVKKYAGLLNRNIILFSQDQPLSPYLSVSLEDEIRSLLQKLNQKIKTTIKSLPVQKSAPLISTRLQRLSFLLEQTSLTEGEKLVSEEDLDFHSSESSIREIPLDQVIAQFLHLDEAKIQTYLGIEGAENFVRYIRVFDLPLLRRLPIIRDVIPYIKTETPLSITARAGRALGRILEKIVDTIYYFADFHGIITPSQLLDRIGRAMVNATKRPAFRLLTFGAFFFIIQAIIFVLDIRSLEPLTKWLSKNLGLPIVIIGAICSVPLAIGMWFMHIAGQASGFYEKVAEAQYINLLEELKYRHCQKDIHLLYERVLRHEHGTDEPPHSLEDLYKRLKVTCNLYLDKNEIHFEPWLEGHLSSMLYRDYLDGAVLHNTDVKTAEQLLGNLTIDNIKRHRLKYSKREMKYLEKLDISEAKGLLGPHIWFRFITDSIAQRTARLVVEYNLHCIPLEDQPLADDSEIQEMEKWLEKKFQKKSTSQDNTEESMKWEAKDLENLNYQTSEFTALHFLTPDPHREEYIESRFGPKVLQALKKDRKEMIRDIFGTYPLHLLPKSERILNPYQMYQDYFAGGKIFLLPFYFLILSFKGIVRFLRFLKSAIQEILHPGLAPIPQEEAHTGFGIALRNINRMRKAIFMEILRMRSFFDYEYLGIPTPGYSLELPSTVMEDLHFVGASAETVRFYQSVIDNRLSQMIKFRQFLKEEGLEGEGFIQFLKTFPNGERLVQERYRVMRILAISYLIDYQGIATAWNSRLELLHSFHRYLDDPPRLKKEGGKGPLFIPGKKIKLFENFLEETDLKVAEKEKQYLLNLFLKNRDFQNLASKALKLGTRENLKAMHRKIICQWHIWNQELVSLRTLQTLSIFDILNYRDVVYKLGEYHLDSRPLEEYEHSDLKSIISLAAK
ncbi:MAG: hypothetical protein D6785_04680, partial [Planctomycetota bacterium]